MEKEDISKNLNSIENEVSNVLKSIKKIESNGISVSATSSVIVQKKGKKVKITVPKSIDEWEGIFDFWDAPAANKLPPAIDKLNDEEIVNLIKWMNEDVSTCINCGKLLYKWNNESRYFNVYDPDVNIIQIKQTYQGGLYVLSQILGGNNVLMYKDTIRYWQPFLDLYNKVRELYNFPIIEEKEIDHDSEVLIQYNSKN